MDYKIQAQLQEQAQLNEFSPRRQTAIEHKPPKMKGYVAKKNTNGESVLLESNNVSTIESRKKSKVYSFDGSMSIKILENGISSNPTFVLYSLDVLKKILYLSKTQ